MWWYVEKTITKWSVRWMPLYFLASMKIFTFLWYELGVDFPPPHFHLLIPCFSLLLLLFFILFYSFFSIIWYWLYITYLYWWYINSLLLWKVSCVWRMLLLFIHLSEYVIAWPRGRPVCGRYVLLLSCSHWNKQNEAVCLDFYRNSFSFLVPTCCLIQEVLLHFLFVSIDILIGIWKEIK